MQSFPDVIVRMARDLRVIKSFYLEYEKKSGECENCGGMGIISLFLATLGPLESPAYGNFVSKWYDGKWWASPSDDLHYGTVSAPCPECHGVKKGGKPVYVPMPPEIKARLDAVFAKKGIKSKYRIALQKEVERLK